MDCEKKYKKMKIKIKWISQKRKRKIGMCDYSIIDYNSKQIWFHYVRHTCAWIPTTNHNFLNKFIDAHIQLIITKNYYAPHQFEWHAAIREHANIWRSK